MTVENTSKAQLGLAMPAYNEARWLDAILERVLARPEVGQVVAVDDGSTDGSWAKLQAWPAKDSRVRIIRHARNRGKGAAIRTALGQLTTPLILIQDADLEYDPADYPKLLEPIQRGEADVVYGSRFLGASPLDGRATLPRSRDPEMEVGSAGASPYHGTLRWHALGNGLLTFASNRLTGLRLTDEATCYKLFKRDVLDRIDLTEDGFGFCPEVTAKLGQLVRSGQVRLVEVPIGYRGRTRADGKKIRLRDGLAALACLWRHRR
jgi:glycosyltransferase involved in cell wall biosynthesis